MKHPRYRSEMLKFHAFPLIISSLFPIILMAIKDSYSNGSRMLDPFGVVPPAKDLKEEV